MRLLGKKATPKDSHASCHSACPSAGGEESFLRYTEVLTKKIPPERQKASLVSWEKMASRPCSTRLPVADRQ